jgi:hypothetical protein
MATQLRNRPATPAAAPAPMPHPRSSLRQPRALEAWRAHELRAAPTTRPNLALAGLELLIGYEFLASGVDKLLYGAFPQSLGGLLSGQLGGGHLPAPFAALLQWLVLPNAELFGWLIEWGEALAGLGLLASGLCAVLRPLVEAHASGRPWRLFAGADRLAVALTPVAAVGAGLLALSFYVLDGLPTFGFTPTIAYGGALDSGLMLALACAIIIATRLVARPHAGH